MLKTILIGLVWLITVDLFAQNKKAFIIAIGNYPKEGGFRKINSANDISLINNALLKLGFKQKDIFVIKDEMATKANILEALEKNFVNSIQKGDIAYFHFSGHGQQVMDLDGDEIDEYDEALVSIDASSQFVPGIYEGQKHLTDDELHRIYNKIRTKLGPKGHFLTTIDACHSGTSTRGIGTARGTDLAMAPPNFRAKAYNKAKDLNQSETKKEDESKMAPHVAFFASMANQLNYEIEAEDGKFYGALSYAFSKAINSISPGSSYQQLFDRMRLIIQMQVNNQIAESSGILFQPILGGKTLNIPNYYVVKEWQDKNTVIIEGGFLNGITNGTIVSFCEPEQRSGQKEICITTGSVKTAKANTSIVKVADGISEKDAEKAWVIVKEENFGELSIDIQCKGSFVGHDREILNELTALPYIKQVESNPQLILINEDSLFLLLTKYDLEVLKISKSKPKTDIVYTLKSAFKQYGQSQYLRKLEQDNPQIALEFEFILLKRKGEFVSESFSKDSLIDASGSVVLLDGDVIQLKVSNTSTKPAYFSFLDIQPDNKINVLFPRNWESPSDYLLAPGNHYISPSFVIRPPFGLELFKLIATKNPVNLRPLDQRRGISDQQQLKKDPFEILFEQTYFHSETTGTRGMNSTLPAGQVNIFSVPFIIKQ